MDYWKAGEKVMDATRKLIAEHHPDLAMVDRKIAIIFREKASKAGGVFIYGKARKAPKILELLGDTDYKFIIELAGDIWNDLNDTQRMALLDHCLLRCKVEYDDNSGEITYSLRNPDFMYFIEEIKRWGVWQDLDMAVDDGQQEAATAIEEVFLGKDE